MLISEIMYCIEMVEYIFMKIDFSRMCSLLKYINLNGHDLVDVYWNYGL